MARRLSAVEFGEGRGTELKRYALTNILIAVPITYAGGLASMILILDIGIWQALTMAVFPFVFGNILHPVWHLFFCFL